MPYLERRPGSQFDVQKLTVIVSGDPVTVVKICCDRVSFFCRIQSNMLHAESPGGDSCEVLEFFMTEDAIKDSKMHWWYRGICR